MMPSTHDQVATAETTAAHRTAPVDPPSVTPAATAEVQAPPAGDPGRLDEPHVGTTVGDPMMHAPSSHLPPRGNDSETVPLMSPPADEAAPNADGGAGDHVMPTSACGITFHPLAQIFPLLRGRAYADMKADI
jgi:hypothetical protein